MERTEVRTNRTDNRTSHRRGRSAGYRRVSRSSRTIRFQRLIITVLLALLILVSTVLLGNMRAYADAENEQELNKYYTSIQVERGETLWEIADRYVEDTGMSKKEYIRELKNMNHIGSNDKITAGDYIIVSYYAAEANVD